MRETARRWWERWLLWVVFPRRLPRWLKVLEEQEGGYGSYADPWNGRFANGRTLTQAWATYKAARKERP